MTEAQILKIVPTLTRVDPRCMRAEELFWWWLWRAQTMEDLAGGPCITPRHCAWALAEHHNAIAASIGWASR